MHSFVSVALPEFPGVSTVAGVLRAIRSLPPAEQPKIVSPQEALAKSGQLADFPNGTAFLFYDWTPARVLDERDALDTGHGWALIKRPGERPYLGWLKPDAKLENVRLLVRESVPATV